MFRVDDVWDEAIKIVGNCSETKFFRWLGDAVTLIANKGDFEGWKGYLDICTTGDRCVTLPREVDNVLAVNLGGRPTLGYGQLFNFHLNGPGDCTKTCGWTWQDQGGFHSTYRDLVTPSRIVAHVETSADNGKQMVIYGFDSLGRKLMRTVDGARIDGYQVPTIYGVAVPEANAPLISRITGIFKADTLGPVTLATTDTSGVTGTLLGVYEPDESLPQYRRIKLTGQSVSWVRIAYRRATPTFKSRWDRIPLRSRLGLLLGVRACKFYHEQDLANAHSYESDASRLELESQMVIESPTFNPMQIVSLNDPGSDSEGIA